MRFRDDIDLANTWIVSDTHFGHDNIVGFCFRPEEHEQVMIAEWRAHVPDDASVIHLGDACYGHNGGNTRFRKIISKELTGGRKLLIQGNHDRQGYRFYKDSGFSLAQPFALGLTVGSDGVQLDPRAKRETPVAPSVAPYVVSFSHYPWGAPDDARTQAPNEWRLHGHIHNSGYTRAGYVPFLRNHLNLSVEQTKYRPINLKLLLDGALLGYYPETTDDQLRDARERRAVAMSKRKAG